MKRDGTWRLSQRFGPYGVRTAADSSGSGLGFELRYRWTGREYDTETGWYYFRARYLDPAQRRFVQEDPIGYAGGANTYAYGSNPIGGRDPSGLAFRYIPERGTLDPEWFDGGGNDGWEGSMISGWDLLTPFERDAGYDEYKNSYEDNAERYREDPLFGEFFEGSRALSREEYDRARRGLSERLGINPVLEARSFSRILDQRFALGQIFVNQMYLNKQPVESGRIAVARTPPGTRFSILSEYIVDARRPILEFVYTLVHETVHAFWPNMEECAIWSRATRVTNYVPAGGPPPGC